MIKIVGIRPVNEEYVNKKAVYDACIKADIEVPDEVKFFFKFRPPPPDMQVIEVDASPGKLHGVSKSGHTTIIDLDQLPFGIRVITITEVLPISIEEPPLKKNAAFERYLEEQLRNPNFAAEYKKAGAEIATADKEKAK